ncbi:MAG: class II aldolase/adducin family protein [Candidatus Eisenbacteria bacterium]|nr:class II aldolase/adducin family protein [Candidatus Eisenbacteria bacterium]
MNPSDPTSQIIEVGRLLYDRSLLIGTEGNLSIRLERNRFLVTAAGVCKGRLRSIDLVTVDGEGRKIAGGGRPSSEILLHLALYRLRPEIRAVAHAHPPTATGFAVAGVSLDGAVLPEVVVSVGSVPTAPYGTPSTESLAEAALPVARCHDAFLLKNHGAVTLGRKDLWEAFHRMEMVESLARITLTARLLGGAQPLCGDEVERLIRLHGDPTPPGCGFPGGGPPPTPEEEDLIGKALRRLEERLGGRD